MRLTPIRRRDFIKRLRKLGWEGPFSGGKHEYMVKGDFKLAIPNPHGSGEISVGKLKEILNEIGIETLEWINAR
jgi:predicted RNA binding protein YcfA (HicA-like mRNA interferase family)